jgi:putative ABC transport system permease protein
MNKRRLSRLWQKPQAEQRLGAELQFHLEQQIADYIAAGLSPQEARCRAQSEFGGIELYKEECRDTRWENQLDTFVRDLRFAWRGLRKDRRFAFVAIFALALAIGASTAVFSVVDNALFEPFPYKDQRSLVIPKIMDVDRGADEYRSFFTIPEMREIQRQNHVFSAVVANSWDDFIYSASGTSTRFAGDYVTPGSFEFFGVAPLRGRPVEDADYRPGNPPVFVLRYNTWLTKFAGDPSIVGKSFTLNGVSRTLIAIMPPRFAWGGAELWVPTSLQEAESMRGYDSRRYWGVVARLKPGVSILQANADLRVIAQSLSAAYPQDYPKHFDTDVERFAHAVVPQRFRRTLYVFLVAVGLLLLIGCGNVANLLLARAITREKEFAVRTALGASRGRLIRQLLAESLLLALGGAFWGTLLAWAGVRVLAISMPDFTIASETVIVMNTAVLVFALVAGVATVFLFGLVPAIQSSRCDLQDALRDAGKGLSGTAGRSRLRNSVIVLEVALSLTLLFTAGLFLRSFVALTRVQLGFRPDHVLLARIPLLPDRYKNSEQIHHFYRPLLDRLYHVPGIEAATVISTPPPFENDRVELEIPGKTHPEKWYTAAQLVSEQYFTVLRRTFREGQPFSDTEVADARHVAIVNEAFRRQYFPTEDPIGRRIRLPELETMPDEPIRDASFDIIGVVDDAKNGGLQDRVAPEMWFPYSVHARFASGLLIRTTDDPTAIINTVAREVWNIDPSAALADPAPLEKSLETFGYAQPRFGLSLVTVFAVLGLLLVSIGVYSVMAYSASRRTHEFGVRVALGARAGDVLGMVLRQGLGLLLAGAALGLAVSLVAGRLLRAQLWGVSQYDVLTLSAVIALLLLVGLAACWVPARRATRINPVTALRCE